MHRLTYYLMKGSENDGYYLKPGTSKMQAIDRLAAYEETGYTPEQIKGLVGVVKCGECIHWGMVDHCPLLRAGNQPPTDDYFCAWGEGGLNNGYTTSN